MSALPGGLRKKRSILTIILDRWVVGGLIKRKIEGSDRRTFVIVPTAKGRKLAQRITHHLPDLERAVIRRVSAADIKGFKNVVSALEEEAHDRTRAKRS